MAYPTYTYTFTNGSTADATQVNQDFNDILNGVTDGTKDINVNAATAAGVSTLNGNVVLGSASTKTLTVNASLASTILLNATNSYDIGAATSGLRALYLAGTSTNTTKLVSAASSSHTLTLPATQGVAAARLVNDGSGNLSWSVGAQASKTTTYTATTSDETILVDGSGGGWTLSLYAASGNAGRKIRIIRTDNTLANAVTVDPNASETIRGALTYKLYSQYESILIECDGTNWQLIDQYIPGTITDAGAMTITGVTANPTKGTMATDKVYWYRRGRYAHLTYQYDQTASAGSANGTGHYLIALPTNLTADTTYAPVSTNTDANLINAPTIKTILPKTQCFITNGTNRGEGLCQLYSTTQFRVFTWQDASAVAAWSSTYWGLVVATLGFYASFEVPISGWEG